MVLSAVHRDAREGLGMIALNKRFGTRTWVKNNNTERLTAFYGDTKTSGMEHYKTLPTTWDKADIHIPSKTPVLLDHGYDETKPFDELTVEDLQKAAAFRGGKLISTEIVDMYTPVTWEDAEGNQFDMTPNTVLRGGHWSPAQDPFPWRYDEIARTMFTAKRSTEITTNIRSNKPFRHNGKSHPFGWLFPVKNGVYINRLHQ